MKVKYFVSRFPVPSETFVLNQINGLIEQGVDVEVLSLKRGSLSHDDALVSKNDLINKTTYLLDEREGGAKSAIIFSRLSSCIKLLLKPSLLFRLFQKRYKNCNSALVFPSVVANISGKLEADIVVAHFGPMGVFAQNLQKIGKLSGKVLTVFHGYDISMKSVLAKYDQDYQNLFEESAAILPISELWKSRLVQMACPSEKVIVNRMGINLDAFKFESLTPHVSVPITVATVARLIEKKGLFDAITAMSLAKSNGLNVKYRIIGSGPLERELANHIATLELSDTVELVGFLPQEDVRRELKAADVFLLPSITAQNGDMEGIPVALMESMAIGLITVSTVHSGIPELIEHGESGFLAPESSPKHIAEILEQITSSEHDLQKIREKAHDVVKTKFNQGLLYKDLKSIIENIHGH